MKREVKGEEKVRCHETAFKLGFLMQEAPTNDLVIDTSRHRLLCFTKEHLKLQIFNCYRIFIMKVTQNLLHSETCVVYST